MIGYVLLPFILFSPMHPSPDLAVIAVSYGTQSYGKVKVDQVNGSGMVKLSGTIVAGQVQVNGQLNAQGARMESMDVRGQAVLGSCIVAQKSSVIGHLSASSSQFSGEVAVCSDQTTFDSCTLSSLRILKTDGHRRAQTVILKGNTKIAGFITFESGNGEVIADSEADIAGKVIGGKIKRLDN